MDVGDHDGETFADNDVILVCAHGGEFTADLVPPSSGTSGNEITYLGVPNGDTLPTFQDGFDNNAKDYLIVQGIMFQPGVAESGTATFEGGRFADATRSWQAAEETAVTAWPIDDLGIFAVSLGATGGNLANQTPQLYWRNKTDAGSFAAVGASGEVKYTTVSGLTDESDVTSGEAGTSSGKTYTTCNTCEQENSHQATSTTTVNDGFFTELQVGVSFADGDAGDEYEFALYESAAQVGSASVSTVTVASCQLWYQYTTAGSQNKRVGGYNSQEWQGALIATGGSAREICKIEVYHSSNAGDYSAKDYKVCIGGKDGSNRVISALTVSTHDGGDDLAYLDDSTASFTTDALINHFVFNRTDESYCQITDNDTTTITCTLENGTDNNWDDGDTYDVIYCSDTVSGSVIDDANGDYDAFPFTDTAALDASTTYSVGAIMDSGGGDWFDGEQDTTNYWETRFDNDSNADSTQVGRSNNAIIGNMPWGSTQFDALDDWEVKIYTMQ
jgi:hypothetical protein